MKKFEWKLQNGYDFSIEINENPIIFEKSKKSKLDIIDLKVNNQKLSNKNVEISWEYRDHKKVLALKVSGDTLKEFLKKIGNKKKFTYICVLCSEEFEDYYINSFQKAVEAEFSKIDAELQLVYEEAFNKLKDDDLIKLNYHTTFKYSFPEKYGDSNYFKESKAFLDAGFDSNKIDKKYLSDSEWGDYSLSYSYLIPFYEFKKIVQESKKNIDKKAEEKAAAEKKEAERRASIFNKARQTGEKQVLKIWSEPCNDPREECNIDNIILYAMPDGSTKTVRVHTW